LKLYEVTVSRSAEKELNKLGSVWIDKICKVIEDLAVNPRPSGCKKLKGSKDLWRVRVADYRIVYAIDDDIRIVAVERIAHRKEVYD
jgi:mRNA interferase RelE/StbE